MVGRIKRYAVWALFLLSVMVFLFHWQVYALSRYPMDGYDQAMRFISRAYVVAGFIPYRNFGIQYPPGFFLLAHVIPFQTVNQQNLAIYSLFLLIVIAAALLMRWFRTSPERYMIAVSAFLLLLVPLLLGENTGDLLVGITILTVFFALRFDAPGKRAFLALFLLPIVSVQWRWDRVVTLLCIEFLLAAPFIVWFLRRRKKRELWHLLHILGCQAAGLAVGLGSLAVYFSTYGGLRNSWEFIYTMPVNIIYAYRDLPIPDLYDFPGILFLCSGLTLGIFFLYLMNELMQRYQTVRERDVLQALFLCAAPFAALPYALGRSDGGHIAPMLFFTGVSMLAAFLLSTARRSYVLLLLLAPLIVASLRFLPPHVYRPYDVFATGSLLEQSLADCRNKAGAISYRSLFVGRTIYERYFNNNMTLYFFNSSVPSATRYIADDPGMQSSCHYGARIAEDLNQAPKPMLAFITDQQHDRIEENKTRDLKSCGKIEALLAAHPYQVLGMCRSYNIPYEIRLYNE